MVSLQTTNPKTLSSRAALLPFPSLQPFDVAYHALAQSTLLVLLILVHGVDPDRGCERDDAKKDYSAEEACSGAFARHMRALRIAVVRHHIAPRAMSATPAPLSPPPRRVLCLHSFRTSSAILHTQMKMARWFDDYARDVEFIAIDAPHAASGDVPADVTAFFGAEGGRYEWWNARDDGAGVTSYDGVEASLRAIELACADADAKGESFDGIMGFSQGATLVGIVLGTPALAARFSFAILVSGMASRATETRNLVLSDVRVPTLHVIGKNDRVMPVTMSEQLFRKFESSAATMVTHAGGHSVPRLDETGAPILRDFLASLST